MGIRWIEVKVFAKAYLANAGGIKFTAMGDRASAGLLAGPYAAGGGARARHRCRVPARRAVPLAFVVATALALPLRARVPPHPRWRQLPSPQHLARPLSPRMLLLHKP